MMGGVTLRPVLFVLAILVMTPCGSLAGEGEKVEDAGFGTLVVTSSPPGLDVIIQATRRGATPFEAQLDPGEYAVKVASPCHYDAVQVVSILRGTREALDFQMKPKQGGVAVRVIDENGDDIVARVLVDGRTLGSTPLKEQVSVCAERLEIVKDGFEPVTKDLEVVAGQLTEYRISLIRQEESTGIAQAMAGQVSKEGREERWRHWVELELSGQYSLPAKDPALGKTDKSEVLYESEVHRPGSPIYWGGPRTSPMAGLHLSGRLAERFLLTARYDVSWERWSQWVVPESVPPAYEDFGTTITSHRIGLGMGYAHPLSDLIDLYAGGLVGVRVFQKQTGKIRDDGGALLDTYPIKPNDSADFVLGFFFGGRVYAMSHWFFSLEYMLDLTLNNDVYSHLRSVMSISTGFRI